MRRVTKKAAVDQKPNANHERLVDAAAPSDDAGGPIRPATQIACAPASSLPASGDGQATLATQNTDAAPLAPIIQAIRTYHRDRVFAMEMRKQSDNQLGAFLRRGMGWSRSLPKAESDAIKKAARDLMVLGEKIFAGKATGIGNAQWSMFGSIITASIHGRIGFADIEKEAAKEMERLAASLPVWPAFGEAIKGFGARSLAVIVGEAGDLGQYGNPAKLWKRMGLAVMDGVRQGGLRKTASKEEWIAHGYNKKRRSYMFVIGDVLVKNKNPYRDIYLARKDYERARAAERGLTVVPAAKIPAKRKDEFMSDGHVHRRAQRYMEKRLLRDLWRAWRRARSELTPMREVPAAEIPQAIPAERAAKERLISKPCVPRATPSAQADAAGQRPSDNHSSRARRKSKVRA